MKSNQNTSETVPPLTISQSSQPLIPASDQALPSPIAAQSSSETEVRQYNIYSISPPPSHSPSSPYPALLNITPSSSSNTHTNPIPNTVSVPAPDSGAPTSVQAQLQESQTATATNQPLYPRNSNEINRCYWEEVQGSLSFFDWDQRHYFNRIEPKLECYPQRFDHSNSQYLPSSSLLILSHFPSAQ